MSTIVHCVPWLNKWESSDRCIFEEYLIHRLDGIEFSLSFVPSGEFGIFLNRLLSGYLYTFLD